MLAGLSSPAEREIYAGRVAQRVGVSKDAVLHEVEGYRKRQVRQTKRKEERSALTPAANIQPKARELRYDDPRSARAEEGVIQLLFLDPTLLELCGDLAPEDFSVPLWGRLYGLIRDRGGTALDPGLFDGELTGAEADLLARLLDQPHSLAEGRQAMADYIEIIGEKTQPQDDPVAQLLAIQAKRQQKQERRI